MSRLAPAATTHEAAERIRRRRGGDLRPLDLALLHSPEGADGWNALLGAVRTGLTLPSDLREAIILRVAVLNDADYEWDAHEPVARRAGLGQDQLDDLRAGRPPAGFDPARLVALEHAEVMTRSITVPDELFERLRACFDDREIVELTLLTATYNMVSRFLVALRIGENEAVTR